MRERIAWLRRRAGFRGMFLLLLGIIDILVGGYLIAVGLPPVVRLLLFDAVVWGGVWAGTGVFLLTGVLWHTDKFQFAAAACSKFAWALEFVHLAVDHSAAPVGLDRYFWLLAMAWLGVACVILLVSAWPEPR